MLQLLTGLPGAGKTLYLLTKVIKKYRGRPIYVHNIPGIDHEHFGTQPLEDPEKWYELPEGSVVIIDEAQKVFPVRKVGSEVPRKSAEFETHRHRGFDVVLLTQDATTLDVHLRKLCGSHIHVHRLFGGQSANIYEYAEFQREPTEARTRKLALHTGSFKYDPAVFDHYKSADIHTVKRKIPAKLIMMPVLLLAAVSAIGYAGYTLVEMFNKDADQVMALADPGIDPRVSESVSPGLDTQRQFLPAVPGLPWTAPAYNQVMRVRTAPKPLCVMKEIDAFTWSCDCYTQQITRMPDIPDQVCRDIAKNGWFDYTKDDRQRGEERRESATSARQSQLARLQ